MGQAQEFGHNYSKMTNRRNQLLGKRCLNIDVFEVKEQCLYQLIKDDKTHIDIYLSIVFAMNEQYHSDWLCMELAQVDLKSNYPWILQGNFNNVLSSGDRMGSLIVLGETQGFQDLCYTIKLTPLKSKGWYITWCTKQKAERGYIVRLTGKQGILII